MKKGTSFLLFLVITALAWASQPTILIVYHSETGNTEAMAQAVYRGAVKAGDVNVIIKTVEEAENKDLLEADAIIVGSPVYNANVTPQVSAFISSWPFEDQPLKDKLGAAFVTAGGVSSGEEITQMNILQSMLIFGMIVLGGPDWSTPFGASAIRGDDFFPYDEPMDTRFLEKGSALGQRVAETAKKMHNK
jgi:NAD(P)H dehydrogenase (quinone)